MSLILVQCSALYAELIKAGIDPVRADEHELWQLAALMEQPSSADPTDPEEINRRIIEERYKAAREGRELNAEDVVGAMSEEQVQAIGGRA